MFNSTFLFGDFLDKYSKNYADFRINRKLWKIHWNELSTKFSVSLFKIDKMIQFFLSPKRMVKFKFTHRVYRIEWKNRTKYATSWFYPNKIDIYWVYIASAHCHRNQIFFLWFGRWSFFIDITSDVSKDSRIGKKNENKKSFFFSRMPFNWRTPLGYLIAYVSESSAIYSALFCATPIICFLFGLCLFCVSMVKDLSADLSLSIVGGTSKPNRDQLKKSFCQIVQSFVDVKQLSHDFISIY